MLLVYKCTWNHQGKASRSVSARDHFLPHPPFCNFGALFQPVPGVHSHLTVIGMGILGTQDEHSEWCVRVLHHSRKSFGANLLASQLVSWRKWMKTYTTQLTSSKLFHLFVTTFAYKYSHSSLLINLCKIIAAPLRLQFDIWALVRYSMNQCGVGKFEKSVKPSFLDWGYVYMSCRCLQQCPEVSFLKDPLQVLTPLEKLFFFNRKLLNSRLSDTCNIMDNINPIPFLLVKRVILFIRVGRVSLTGQA